MRATVPTPPAATAADATADRDVPAPPIRADDELADLDAVATAQAIRAGDLAPGAAVEAALARAADLDEALRALAHRAPDAARRAVPLARGPLAGVPTAVKDLYEHAGQPTGFGSRAAAGHVSTTTAAAVAQLLATGLVSIGKSTAPEYGMTPTTEPRAHEPTRNPWAPQHSTGGSSGGAAALVAARVVPIAHATDGGGSIRIPAACCGLVGLKPSRGRLVDLPGNREMPVGLLSSGVVTRTVRDTAAFLAAAEQRQPARRLPRIGVVDRPGDRRLRIGLVTASAIAAVDPEVVEATARTGHALESLGHRVEQVDLPVDEAQLAADFLVYWGMLALTLPVLGRVEVGRGFRADRLEPWTRGLAQHARARWAQLPGAIARLRRLSTDHAALTARHHLLVSPTIARTAPPLGWLDVDLPFEVHRDRAVAMSPFAPLWNVVGAPAVSLPMARSRDGLPIGVQLSAGVGEERRLLEVALELEQAAGFLTRLPARSVG